RKGKYRRKILLYLKQYKLQASATSQPLACSESPMLRDHYDVIIVGGAATGSAAACFLGLNSDFDGSVLVLEQDPSYQYCATALSAASIRHQFSTPENIRMSQFGTQFLREFPEQMRVDDSCPDPSFQEGGYLFLATDNGLGVLTSNLEVQTSLQADIALLSATRLSEQYPWMNTADLAAGSLGLSGEGWLDAYGMMQGMRKKAIQLGAQYHHAAAHRIQLAGKRATGVVLADGQRIDGGAVIIAAGTSAPALAATAGISLPV